LLETDKRGFVVTIGRIASGSKGLSVKAIIFDFIGTLVKVVGYSYEDSIRKLCKSIVKAGFNVDSASFLEVYKEAHLRYREIRYGKLVEVTNAVWISEALNKLGYETTSEDKRIKQAVNAFFQDYLESLKTRKCAKKVLKWASSRYRLGLISNFTYAPVIYAALRKLKLAEFFGIILVSHAVGWRKPHPKIFQKALTSLKVKPEETVFVGDSPREDIEGAKKLGMKTIFVPSQFYNVSMLKTASDCTVKNLCELPRVIGEIFPII
jgi:putative hydrolase of the HAD superfamily